MKKMIFGFLFFASLLFAQNLGDDPQKVKEAYVNCTLYVQELLAENAALKNMLSKVEKDLRRIETKDQLDSLKQAYGLIKGMK